MGGTNYSSSRESEHEIPKGIRALYIDSLADYRRALSEGANSFFAVSAAVGKAVRNGGGALDAAIEQLNASERALNEAVVGLGAVASLWPRVSDAHVPFGEQHRLITAAADKVRLARQELMTAAAAEESLREYLQRNAGLVESFGEARLAINRLRDWQAKFARTPKTIGVTA